jgi:hypothetical protein
MDLRHAAKPVLGKLFLCIIVAALLLAASPPFLGHLRAAELTPRTMLMSSSLSGDGNVTYELLTEVATDGPVGSMAIEFCDNSPLEEVACNAPAGFDATNVVLANQSGITGFVISTSSTANVIILSRPPAFVAAGTQTDHAFRNIINPANDGPLFIRILTYPSSDASGPATDSGGMAHMINPGVSINAEVPPFIIFCVGESIGGLDCNTATEAFSDVGDLSSLTTGAAQHQALIATNAGNGYSMWVMGTSMTSGNNVLPAMSGGPSQKGVPQFGINLRANSNPQIGQNPTGPGNAGVTPGYNQPNNFRFQSGDALATALAPDDYRKYTISYIVNVAPNQPGGVYSTTLTYVALGNF